MSDSMQELKQMRIWFLWRWGTDKNGNPTKVPFAANGGETGTDNAHSSTWVTDDEVTAAVIKNHAAGVGFKIPDGYFFLDIAHPGQDANGFELPPVIYTIGRSEACKIRLRHPEIS